MRGNLKAVSQEPQYVEAKLSCTEFQEAKKLLFQVKIFVASFGWKKIQMYTQSRGDWDLSKLLFSGIQES